MDSAVYLELILGELLRKWLPFSNAALTSLLAWPSAGLARWGHHSFPIGNIIGQVEKRKVERSMTPELAAAIKQLVAQLRRAQDDKDVRKFVARLSLLVDEGPQITLRPAKRGRTRRLRFLRASLKKNGWPGRRC